MELGSLFEEHQESLPSWRDLEKAPYLAAVIKEGLRFVSSPDVIFSLLEVDSY
jgi:hypothetical protein